MQAHRARRIARLKGGVLPRADPRAALNDLSIGLARHPDVVSIARQLVRDRHDRLSRIATVFTFVGQLVDVPSQNGEAPFNGVDLLLGLAGEEHGPAVIVSALLRALGEHARIECVAGMAFVRVEVDERDLARLPPHARPSTARGRYYIPLDARRARSPLGFLPFPVRSLLLSRQTISELPSGATLLRRSRSWQRA